MQERSKDEIKPVAARTLFDAALGENVPANVVLREDIHAGQFVAGPCAITEIDAHRARQRA